MIPIVALAPIAAFGAGILVGYFARPEEIADRKREDYTPQSDEEKLEELQEKVDYKELPKWTKR